jgi:rhamnose transport system permease protein
MSLTRTSASGARRVAVPIDARTGGPAAFLVALAIVFGATGENFWTFNNVRSVFFVAAILVIATLAQSAVVVTRNLDLSIGAIMAGSAYFALLVVDAHPGLGDLLLPMAIVIGAAMGAVNGLIVAFVGIPSLIATLGTLSLFRGLIYASANGRQISVSSVPDWLLSFVAARPLGIPALVIVGLAAVLLLGVVFQRTSFGRNLFAVGSSAQASEFYGLPRRATVFRAFVLSGALAAVAGTFLAGRAGTVTVDIATGYELQTLAAAVIGGASLLGGTGSALGAALGALILATIDNGLVQIGLSGYWQGFVQGCAIVLAVGFDVLLKRQFARRMERR